MHIVAIAWVFVVVIYAAAEATAPHGSLLGALFTLLLWGALPLSIVLYVMGASARRRARHVAEQAEAQRASADPHAGGESAGDPVPTVRKKP